MVARCTVGSEWSVALRTAVLAHDSRAKSSDCQNDPDPDHRYNDSAFVSTNVGAVSEHGYKASNPSADPRANPQPLGSGRQ